MILKIFNRLFIIGFFSKSSIDCLMEKECNQLTIKELREKIIKIRKQLEKTI